MICKECGAELMINAVKITSLQVFCPASECVEFAQSFWIDKPEGWGR